MATRSKIEWTDSTWNVVTGCSKVSAGCKNCYAETMFKRLASMPDLKQYYGRKFTDVQCHDDRLDQPLHWRKPQRVFVNSMSDLFHESVPVRFIAKVFNTMASWALTCKKKDHEHDADCCRDPKHTYMILTKRPDRMLKVLTEDMLYDFSENWQGDCAFNITYDAGYYPLDNVWLGVSVEDQQTADERIPLLLETPAAKRFVSIEPMLDEVNLYSTDEHDLRYNYLTGKYDGNNSIGNKLDWIILGGESGKKARPMKIEWARNVKDQCVEAGVPFFLKQMQDKNGELVKMPKLDGKVWSEYPRIEKGNL